MHIPASSSDLPHLSPLSEGGRRSSEDQFRYRAEPYRRELQLHCYRMLGSLHDAEDLVQETFLRAWRGLDRFEGRTSFRAWLYRIATNACLNALASRSRARRVLPETIGPPSEERPEGEPPTEIAWLEPYPDTALEGIADTAPGPEARYEIRESVNLAFVAVIQQLPPRQRAILLLCDVLGWSATETARLLDASLASVNSALQRARATLKKRFPTGPPGAQPTPDDRQRALLDRYVRAWEGDDLDSFVSLLREDAILSMPPWREWYSGREAIQSFFAWAWSSGGHDAIRLVPTAANRQPAFALYKRRPHVSGWQAYAIQLLTIEEDAIVNLTLFLDTELFAAFGLPIVTDGSTVDIGSGESRGPFGPWIEHNGKAEIDMQGTLTASVAHE